MSSHHEHPPSEVAEVFHEHSAFPYHLTLIALLILTFITVGASYIHFGSGAANVVIALTIATVKGTLVALVFMHLKDDKKVNAIIATAGFLFLGIFLMFCLLDFGTRRDPIPHTVPALEKATPVPDTLNPLLAPPPKPVTPAKIEEGEPAAEHK
jgi:caa(3)-type oxidase subunit IV